MNLEQKVVRSCLEELKTFPKRFVINNYSNMLSGSQFCKSTALKASVIYILYTEDNYSSFLHLTAVITFCANLTVIIVKQIGV